MTPHDDARPEGGPAASASPATSGEALAAWIPRAAAALGVPAALDLDAVLGTAGVVAHGVVRPAAPVTTYLVGVAVGAAIERGEDREVAFRAAVAAIRGLVDAAS